MIGESIPDSLGAQAMKKAGANNLRCSIIIRAYNEVRHISRLLTGIAKQSVKDIEVILVDSDGLVEELTDLMLEAGMTALYPYEVLAGNDVGRVLKRYPEVGIIGGLRKEAMYEGKEAIDREMEKARVLIKKGRYIPGPDHFVLQLASFANYRYFMESLRDVVMTTKPEI